MNTLISHPTHSQLLLTSGTSYISPSTAQSLSFGLFQHPQHTQQCDMGKLGRGCCFDLMPLLWARGEEGRGLKSKTFTSITKTIGLSWAAMLMLSLSHGSVSNTSPETELEKNMVLFLQYSPFFDQSNDTICSQLPASCFACSTPIWS